MSNDNTVQIMDAKAFADTLDSLAGKLLNRPQGNDNLALVGIQRRGVFLASRLAGILSGKLGAPIPQGVLDINLYRDDWTTLGPRAVVGVSNIPFDLAGRDLVLVDDVLFTGRTIRAALEALADFGRPRKVELMALVDRGHRELPIHADYVGLALDTERADTVDVLVSELDGKDAVYLRKSSV